MKSWIGMVVITVGTVPFSALAACPSDLDAALMAARYSVPRTGFG